MPKASKLDNLTTIRKERLRSRLTSLSTEKLRDVEVAIHFALGLQD